VRDRVQVAGTVASEAKRNARHVALALSIQRYCFRTRSHRSFGVLDKAAAHAATCKFDPAIYLTTRLRPDMFAFSRQVQTACDQAKNGTARLAGVEPPRFDDKEASLDELNARIKATLAFLKSVDPMAVDASGDREIVFPVGSNKMKMKGADYLFISCSQISIFTSRPPMSCYATTASELANAISLARFLVSRRPEPSSMDAIVETQHHQMGDQVATVRTGADRSVVSSF